MNEWMYARVVRQVQVIKLSNDCSLHAKVLHIRTDRRNWPLKNGPNSWVHPDYPEVRLFGKYSETQNKPSSLNNRHKAFQSPFLSHCNTHCPLYGVVEWEDTFPSFSSHCGMHAQWSAIEVGLSAVCGNITHNFIRLLKRQHNYTQKNESEKLTNQQHKTLTASCVELSRVGKWEQVFY